MAKLRKMKLFKKSLAQNFEKFAEKFSQTRRQIWRDFVHFENEIRPNFQVLDLGCGNGRATKFFLEKKCHSVGLDQSRKLLQIARKKFPQQKFFLGKMQNKFPLKNESFDRVFAIASFHHLQSRCDRANCLAQIHRILKKDGKFLGTVWNLQQKKFRSARFAAKLRAIFLPFFWSANDLKIPFGIEKIPRFYFSFSCESLRQLLSENFFTVEKIFFTKNGKVADEKNGHNIFFCARKISNQKICGVRFDILKKGQVLKKLEKFSKLKNSPAKFCATPNPEMCVAAHRNERFAKILQKSNLNFADGVGILWAANFKGKNILVALFSLLKFFGKKNKGAGNLQRVPGVEIFQEFCRRTDRKVFLLGGKDGVAQKCGERFAKENPNFSFACDEGSFEKFDEKRILQKIEKSGAQVLFVAFGAPRQEFWLARNLPKLPQIRLGIGVGGAFDFLAGKVRRAPTFLRNLGFEWLWRLIYQPWRILRIARATLAFAHLCVLKNRRRDF